MSVDRATLVALFGTASSPGWSPESENEDEETVFERTGTPSAMCWAWAAEAKASLADAAPGCLVEQRGFWCSDNPGTSTADHCDGHDFAVVDGRWIVDGWLPFVSGCDVPSVLDMQDPADAQAIRTWHGDPTLWDPDRTGDAMGMAA